MNMFKPVGAKSVKEYLAKVPAERGGAMLFLHGFIQTSVPKLKTHFAYNMLGYGSFPYKSYKGKIMSWPIVALASQKNYISIYVCAVEGGKYIAEKHKRELGRVSVGRSCIRFRRLSDINLPALKRVLRAAAKNPGLVGAGGQKKKKTK